ncbi:uncharacterized protein LOC132783543 [Drosophila nasuta]|uniref:uncharacterized protein LOC132783543 n=1 Tax=Drosophila nasuta TaxID=42062 RepID=UPI00295EE014|nr:uncharacterized protein LOC132783543 [Drosophila nasuta]
MEQFTSRFLQKTQQQEDATLPTRIRCMQQLCVDIEANDKRTLQGAMMPIDNLLGYLHNDSKFEQMHEHMQGSNLIYNLTTPSLSSGYGGYEVQQLSGDNNSSPSELITALRSAIDALERSPGANEQVGDAAATRMESDTREPTFPLEQRSPQPTGNNELQALTDLVRQTMFRLDNYMALQAEQQTQQLDLDPYLMPELPANPPSFMNPLKQLNMWQQLKTTPSKGRVKRTVKVMPVQPLVIMPPTPPPQSTPAPERYRLRPRKKRATAAAPSAIEVPKEVKETKRDSGTTMWCPSEYCQHFCGVNCAPNFKSDDSIMCPHHHQLHSSQDTIPGKTVRCAAGTRHQPEMLEEHLPQPSEQSSLLDDWYETAQRSLAELETEKNNYTNMSSCEKLQQTDSCETVSEATDTENLQTKDFIATTDKGVNTTSNVEKPMKLVRIYKCSALQAKKSPSKSQGKVRFVKDTVSKSETPYSSSSKESTAMRRTPVAKRTSGGATSMASTATSAYPRKSSESANQAATMAQPSWPALTKLRVLSTMSEATEDSQRRRCRPSETARFQQMLEEEEQKAKEAKAKEFANRFGRCKGGTIAKFDTLPTYPSGWTQVAMME